MADLVDDTTPELGGVLESAYKIKFTTSALGFKDLNDNEFIRLLSTVSAVNYIDLHNAASGSGIEIHTEGTDGNIDLELHPKGDGRVVIDGTSLPEGTAAVQDGVVADASGNLIYAPIPPRPNLLVNGALEVWQRDTSYTAIAHAESWAHNWRFHENGSVVGNMAQLALVDGNQQASWYGRYDVTTADAAMGILDYVNVTTYIEGYDFGQANWGTAAARDITVQFAHGHTKTGTYSILFSNGANDRTYAVEYTQSVANTWEYETITIPGDTSGSWPVDETTGLRIMLSMAVGTLIDTATVDAWQAGGYWGTDNQVNAVDHSNNYLRMGPMKVEIGSEATPFQPVNFATELKKCQRYWFKSYDYDTAPGTATIAGSFRRYRTSAAVQANETVWCTFGQHMRVTPTIVTYSTATGTSGKIRDTVAAADVTANLPGTGNEHGTDPWAQQNASNASLNFQVHCTADARMG